MAPEARRGRGGRPARGSRLPFDLRPRPSQGTPVGSIARRAAGRHSRPFSTRRSLQLVQHVIDRELPPALDRPSPGRLRTVVPRHAQSTRDAASDACVAGTRHPSVDGRAGASPSWDLPAGSRLARCRGRGHRHLRTRVTMGTDNEGLRPPPSQLMTGDEPIVGTSATVRDFWAWTLSDLRTNTVRPMLAESSSRQP